MLDRAGREVSESKFRLSVLRHTWMLVSFVELFTQLNVILVVAILSACKSTGARGVPGAASVDADTKSVNGDSFSDPTALILKK